MTLCHCLACSTHRYWPSEVDITGVGEQLQTAAARGVHVLRHPTHAYAGFGATLQCWEPQLEQLLQPRQEGLTRVLLMDNRGVGRSASPQDRAQYTTSLMAQDILGILVSPVLPSWGFCTP